MWNVIYLRSMSRGWHDQHHFKSQCKRWDYNLSETELSRCPSQTRGRASARASVGTSNTKDDLETSRKELRKDTSAKRKRSLEPNNETGFKNSHRSTRAEITSYLRGLAHDHEQDLEKMLRYALDSNDVDLVPEVARHHWSLWRRFLALDASILWSSIHFQTLVTFQTYTADSQTKTRQRFNIKVSALNLVKMFRKNWWKDELMFEFEEL